MLSIKSLFQQAIRSWRRRGVGPKPSKRSGIALEQLDHRQLLAVNFTGIGAVDIPATTNPGTVILVDNGTARHPVIPSDLQPIIKVSGVDVSGIRLEYTPSDDILSVAIDQPDNQKTGTPVLAGDTDNNGNGGTVASAVLALRPTFIDFPFLGGSESMGVFLNFDGTGVPQVVAGIANNPGAGKLYQVSDAVVNPDPNIAKNSIPNFGAQLLSNTGASFLSNDPLHPNFEFQITNFSKLYLQETGHALTTTSEIDFGAFGTSNDDDGISEAFVPAQPGVFGVIPPVPPTPPPPPICPPVPPVVPVSPPVLINPHENRHVNTAHPTDVRVSILGTSGFDVTKIDPTTVEIGGAHQLYNFDRHVNNDEFEDRTFIFRGSDIKLPRGITTATVTGDLTNGTPFSTSVRIFDRNDSYFTPKQIAARDARWSAAGFSATNPPPTPSQRKYLANMHDKAMEDAASSKTADFVGTSTVKIARKNAASSVKVDSASSPTAAVGSPSATRTGFLAGSSGASSTVTIPLRPVAQAAAPVTVKIPRRGSTSGGDTIAAPQVKTKPRASSHAKAGFFRAASTRA